MSARGGVRARSAVCAILKNINYKACAFLLSRSSESSSSPLPPRALTGDPGSLSESEASGCDKSGYCPVLRGSARLEANRAISERDTIHPSCERTFSQGQLLRASDSCVQRSVRDVRPSSRRRLLGDASDARPRRAKNHDRSILIQLLQRAPIFARGLLATLRARERPPLISADGAS